MCTDMSISDMCDNTNIYNKKKKVQGINCLPLSVDLVQLRAIVIRRQCEIEWDIFRNQMNEWYTHKTEN